jgi:hypothetical protein
MYLMKFSDFQTDKVEKLKLASLFLWLIGAGHSVKSFFFLHPHYFSQALQNDQDALFATGNGSQVT